MIETQDDLRERVIARYRLGEGEELAFNQLSRTVAEVFGFPIALLTVLPRLDWRSALFNRAALVLLWLSDHAIRAALRLPAMWFEGRCTHPWLGEAALVGLLALLLAGYALGWRRRYGGFWMPFVYVALVLLLGAKFI